MPMPPRLANISSPSRLYSLCRLIQMRPGLSRRTLADYMQPSGLQKNQEAYKTVFNTANQLGLLKGVNQDQIYLSLDESDLVNPSAFRWAIMRKLDQEPEQVFMRFTAWYLQRGKAVYTEKPETLAQEFEREVNQGATEMNQFNATNINAWKTWIAFLGYGILHNSVLIPDVSVRLYDVLKEDKSMLRGQQITVKDFMAWLGKRCPELDGGEISRTNTGDGGFGHQRISIGLSAALRGLHNKKVLELLNINDAPDLWYLVRVDNHPIVERFTHIVLRGVEYEG